MPVQATTFRTLDGLHLRGTLVSPATSTGRAVVLVHGGGVTRDGSAMSLSAHQRLLDDLF